MTPRAKLAFLASASLALLAGPPGARGQGIDEETRRLRGTWDITAMIQDGTVVSQTEVRDWMAQDGRVVLNGQTLSFIQPDTNSKRELIFTVNPAAEPKTIDIAGGKKGTSLGIYRLEGETLTFCLGRGEAARRPTDFSATPGSDSLLVILRREPGSRPAAPAEPAPEPKLPEPRPAAARITTDDKIRELVMGAWGHQDDQKAETVTFNPDGTFSTTRSWKRGFRKIFHEDLRSSGTWKLKDGVVILTNTASTNPNAVLQVFSYRITDISPSEATYITSDGWVRRMWKVR